jgi:hypothetical protein
MKPLPALTEDPPKEDSPDLMDAEVERAIFARDAAELTRLVTENLRHNRSFSLSKHELRRRGEHLYWRVTLVANKEPNKVLVFLADWLQGDNHAVQQQSILDID